MKYNLKEDLAFRSLDQQVEILWISGPTWHDAPQIEQVLGLTTAEIVASLARLRKAKKI